jgi:iron complex transport system substrate-binding protein
MAELGVPVLALPLHSVEQVLAAMRELGRVLGVPERAETLVRDLEHRRQVIRARSKGLPSPRVLFVYGFDPLVVAGPGSFAAELLADAGARNAAENASQPYATYSMETALAAKPDVVIDASDVGGGERFRQVGSLARARWVKLPSQDLLHPGPKLAEGLEQLFALLHGPADGGR